MTFYNFSGRMPVEMGDRREIRFIWQRIVGVVVGPWFIGMVRGVTFEGPGPAAERGDGR